MNTIYLLRVEGHLDDHWATWLGELELTRCDDGSTTLAVAVADQARLHGVLTALRDIGAVLIELRTADAPRTVPEIGTSAHGSRQRGRSTGP